MKRLILVGVLAALAVTARRCRRHRRGGNATGTAGGSPKDTLRGGITDLPSPLGQKQRELVKEAVQQKLQGKIPKDAKVAKVGKDKGAKGEKKDKTAQRQVRRAGAHRRGHDLVRADGVRHRAGDAQPRWGRSHRPRRRAGPLHNQIAQPNRAVDNSTIWAPDFSKSYYDNLLFSEAKGVSSMRNFYIENSSGAYAVNGTVEDWVKLPFNEAAYGSNYCGSIVCVRDIQRLLEDGLNGWYARQVAAGKTDAQINTYLAQFDKWDRYDYNNNGNFNEPDGYIDHFQAIHAGEGEETGGGAAGHRRDLEPSLVHERRRPVGTSARRSTCSAVSGSATRTSGSATTPSSPRTVESACSHTSSATTSASRTSTTRRATPAAQRTRPASGRRGRAARTGATARRRTGSATGRSR